VIKVGLTLKPFATHDFTFTANYIGSRIANSIETFPAASAAIEAAFPDRFIRDADGELVEENDRPLNFASWDREELRWGVNYTMPVGKQPPPPVYSRRAISGGAPLLRRAVQRRVRRPGGQFLGGSTTGASDGPPGHGGDRGPDADS
jgi:iron complex outermembrane receptor protein